MVNVDSSVDDKRTSALSGTGVIRIPGGIRLLVGNARQAPIGTALSNDGLCADTSILLNEVDLRDSLIFTLMLCHVKGETHIRIVR